MLGPLQQSLHLAGSRRPAVTVAVLALTSLATGAHAGSLRKIWDFDMNASVTDTATGAQGVFALAFSRDGKKIAAVVGRSSQEESIVLLDSGNPHSEFVKIEVNPEIWEQEPGAGSRRFDWSLSGRELVVANRIVQIPGGAFCTLPTDLFGAQFVGSAQVAGYQLKPSRILFFDLHCRITGTWELPAGQFVEGLDASPERGILFLAQHTISHAHITEVSKMVIETSSRKILRQLPTWSEATALTSAPLVFLHPRFANWGKSFVWMRGDEWHRIVGCSAVDTAQTVGTTASWNLPDVRLSLGAFRVVISDYAKKLDWIDLRWHSGSLRKRVVWDFHSGREIVRWQPKEQKVFIRQLAGVRPAIPRTQPYRFDISPDGEYIVEGGAGTISLYKIQP